MRSSKIYYSFLIASCILFTACQKEDIAGGNDYKTLGTAANNFLTASPYSLLQIQISYMPGHAPDAASVNNLKVFLDRYINKPAGIQVILKPIASNNNPVITLSEMVKTENQYRTSFTAGSVIAVHILVTDGVYTNPDIFASSYWSTSFCVFGKTINDNSGGPGQISRSQLLSTIFQHEFGHLLGLVDQGSPAQQNHRDGNHGAHCNNDLCLMYHGIETTIGGVFNGIPELDANCKNDLKANGGK